MAAGTTAYRYGRQVHDAWHSSGLAPALRKYEELPGSWIMVVRNLGALGMHLGQLCWLHEASQLHAPCMRHSGWPHSIRLKLTYILRETVECCHLSAGR